VELEIKEMKSLKEQKNISQVYRYTRMALRIIVSSLIGIVGGIGMQLVFIFWSMYFIPEIVFAETASFPILTILFQSLFLLGPQIIAGFISTNIKKATITAIVICCSLGIFLVILSSNFIQGIVNQVVIFVGTYFGGYLAEN